MPNESKSNEENASDSLVWYAFDDRYLVVILLYPFFPRVVFSSCFHFKRKNRINCVCWRCLFF